MKRAIIKGIWGTSEPPTKARNKLKAEIPSIIKHQFTIPSIIYAFGQENCDFVKKSGANCILLNDNPAPFESKYQFRNKLEMIKYAMEVDGYDEILWIDWDCVPIKKMPDNYWGVLNKKESFQACLHIYHRKKCGWRKRSPRTVPNGGFIYLRDKTIISKVINIWEGNQQDNDEPAWAKYTDSIMGEFIGTSESLKKYWDMFEPYFCNLHGGSPFSEELLKSKDICFIHNHG